MTLCKMRIGETDLYYTTKSLIWWNILSFCATDLILQMQLTGQINFPVTINTNTVHHTNISASISNTFRTTNNAIFKFPIYTTATFHFRSSVTFSSFRLTATACRFAAEAAIIFQYISNNWHFTPPYSFSLTNWTNHSPLLIFIMCKPRRQLRLPRHIPHMVIAVVRFGRFN